ncbi:MalY/PatB family protein [Streptococcus merionis]|uniref:cysteine-S-conjugate beta-lyase n=1 Tax=Streptococcus merionis TaxID=400065 RepID=A0A239ST64_9STRE|nr:MalY/PatB family protein [Streptococcus merionis]SNU88459.1 putative cystathionine beta-lyase [Streptococcus merionis]
MTYDFTKRPNRLNTHSVKWKEVEQDPNLLPMWIADMDFYIAPEIKQAMASYIASDDYGYAYEPDSLYQSVIDWEARRYGNAVHSDDILFVSGVVPSLSIALQALTSKNDAVLINTPYYGPIPRTIQLLERQLVKNNLVKNDGRYQIDFEQLEQDIINHDVKLYVLCNPHNPSGRVWTRAELQRLGELCLKHDVLIVIDEIHRDLTLYDHKHTSFNTVDERFKDISITLASATKTFNIAGTKNSYALIPNANLRQKFTKQRMANNQHEVSTLGMIATEAAFTHGEAWLTELKTTLEKNIDYLVRTLESQTKIKVMKPEASYLVWLDFSAYGFDEETLIRKCREEAALLLSAGTSFGQAGKQHARINIAMPFDMIKEACQRLTQVFG